MPTPQGKYGRRDGLVGVVELDVVDAHPVAAAVATVVDALEADDVIEAGTDLRVHTGQSELRGGVIRP